MSTNPYLALITSEHNQQPNYTAMIALMTQASVDNQATLATFATIFNLFVAVGDQLDKLGYWVGANRNLKVAVGGSSVLNDNDYRVLLEAVIAQNYWDGTVPGAYALWATVFQAQGYQIFIQDNQDMSMFLVFLAAGLSNVVLALIRNGYFDLRPAGVQMIGYYEPSVVGVPFFGLDAENATVSGMDVGAWVVPI